MSIPLSRLAAVAIVLLFVLPSAAGADSATVITPEFGAPAESFDLGNHTYSNGPAESISCASEALCVAGDGHSNVISSTNPTGGASAWSETSVDASDVAIRDMSCTTAAFCAASVADGVNSIVFTTDPAGGSWGEAHFVVPNRDALGGLSCPSSSLCVAVDENGNVVYSTDPTAVNFNGWAVGWTTVPVDGSPDFTSISCPSTTFCAATTTSGAVVTSTNPVGGSSDWKVTPGIGPNGAMLSQISCVSTVLCVAIDGAADVVSSTNPTATPATWRAETHVDANDLQTISCASTSLCVAGDAFGTVITSTDPTHGALANWAPADIDGTKHLTSVSCAPATTLCAAVDSATGTVLTSTNPVGGAGTWTATPADTYVVHESNVPDGLSCPSTGLCVAVDSYGNVLVSSNPVGGASTWASAHIDGSSVLSGISCSTASLCVAVDEAGNVLSTASPTGGAAAWTAASIDPGHQLKAVSCSTESFCVAVDDAGYAFASANPTGGVSAWKAADIDGSQSLLAISCASDSLCVAGDQSGDVVASTDPGDPTPSWTATSLPTASAAIDAVSCPSSSFCLAGDFSGIFTSTDPAGSPAAWTAAPANGATTLSCPSTLLCLVGDTSSITFVTTPASHFTWGGGYGGEIGPVDVSCPSDSMCVAVYGNGRVIDGVLPPSVGLGPVESLGPTSATLTGTVNPNGFNVTDCYFAYGVGTMGGVPNKVPCNTAPGSGTRGVAVTATLAGLSPQTTYEYALFATNATGLAGSEFPSFTTPALGPPPPPVPTQRLTVEESGTGSGTVTSSPSGIDCGTTCVASFPPGSSLIILTATPAPGSMFMGWAGACTGSICRVTLNSNQTVTATFTTASYALVVIKAGNGSGTVTSTPSGISCGSTCSHTYSGLAHVTLSPIPHAGSTFAGWSGACSGRSPCTVTMTSAEAVTATFHTATGGACIVPKVKGEALGAAERSVRSHGCAVGKIKHATSKTVKKGHVISQTPSPGPHLAHGARINLTVSKGNP